MSKPVWEAYALRYATHDRTRRENFLNPPDPHDTPMPMDYFVWLLRGSGGEEIVVDTGFDEEMATNRGRRVIRPVADCLRGMGTNPASVSDVIVTHLHYDHAGGLDLFPAARFHVQEREMAFATGRHMCARCIRQPFEAEHVIAMVRALYADRVEFHDGEAEVAPGVSVHRVGGHSDGLQVVRVLTRRGPVVLASDASHYYENLQQGSPFPIFFDLGAMVQGWRVLRQLAGGQDDRIIPGHDPAVRRRYPAVPGGDGEVVSLHSAPILA